MNDFAVRYLKNLKKKPKNIYFAPCAHPFFNSAFRSHKLLCKQKNSFFHKNQNCVSHPYNLNFSLNFRYFPFSFTSSSFVSSLHQLSSSFIPNFQLIQEPNSIIYRDFSTCSSFSSRSFYFSPFPFSPFYSSPFSSLNILRKLDNNNMRSFFTFKRKEKEDTNKCKTNEINEDVVNKNQKEFNAIHPYQSANEDKIYNLLKPNETNDFLVLRKNAAYLRKHSEKGDFSATSTKKTNLGLKNLFIFVLIHFVLVGGLIFVLKKATEVKIEEENAFFNLSSADDILNYAKNIIKSSNSCFLVSSDNSQPSSLHIVNVIPHIPEERIFYYPSNSENENNEKNKSFFLNNEITDTFTGKSSEFSLPLNLIHFCLKSDSLNAKILEKTRNATLFYYNHIKCAYVYMDGLIAIVKNEKLRRHYWKKSWASILRQDNSDYLLLKFVPNQVVVRTCGGGQNHWEEKSVIRHFVEFDEKTKNKIEKNIVWVVKEANNAKYKN